MTPDSPQDGSWPTRAARLSIQSAPDLESPTPSRPNANLKDRTVPVPTIPDHELLSLIGQGSYGYVWLARNIMGGYRAVKVIYRRSFDHDRPFEREYQGIQKFEPVSRSHPSQLSILHVGRTPDYFYYVMEAADPLDAQPAFPAENAEAETEREPAAFDWTAYRPRTLKGDLKRRSPLPFAECLELGLTLTTALAHLHRKGLVHRDIKPSNIIFVHGLPKLADIGLVASANEALSFVGTEGYIPPEGPGSPQADMFSLGKVLYEALTGQDRHDFPDLPTSFGCEDPTPANELNAIILRACDPNPKRRYGSAEAMHADLVLVQSGKSVRTYRRLERGLRLSVRLGTAALLAAVLGVSAWYHETTHSDALSKLATDNARLATDRRQQLVRVSVASGLSKLAQGDHFSALPWFAAALRLDSGTPDAERNHRLRIASTLAHAPKLVQLWSHQASITSAEFHPARRRILSSSEDGTACVWDIDTGRKLLQVQHPAAILSAHFSSNGLWLVTASADHSARVWSAESGQPLGPSLLHQGPVVQAKFSPDGHSIATASADHTARIWSVPEGQPLTLPLPHEGIVQDLDFSPDGSLLATLGKFGAPKVWATPSGRLVAVIRQTHKFAYSIRFHPDGQRLLIAGWGIAHVNDLEQDGATVLTLPHAQAVYSACFSPDARSIVTASEDRTVRAWDSETGEPLFPPLRASHAFRTAVFSPNQHYILTGCENGAAQLWDAISGEPLGARLQHSAPVVLAVFSHSERFALTADRSGLLRLWDLATLTPLGRPLKHTSFISLAATSPDSTRLLTASEDQSVRLWNLASAQSTVPPLEHDALVSDACFSPDGQIIATASFDGSARLWRAATGEPLARPLLHPQRLVVRCAFSPSADRLFTASVDSPEPNHTSWTYDPADGKLIAGGGCVATRDHRAGIRVLTTPILLQNWEVSTGLSLGPPMALLGSTGILEFDPTHSRLATEMADGTVAVWDAVSGEKISAGLQPKAPLNGLRFRRDGRWLATFSGLETEMHEPGEARVWEVLSSQPITPPLAHPGPVLSAAFTSDGAFLATAARDDKARIWKVPSGELAIAPLVHNHTVFDVDFSPDDRWLLTGSGDRTARLWDCQTGEMLTPPLAHPGYVLHAQFAGSNLRIVTALHQSIRPAFLESTAYSWDLPSNASPIQVLHRVSELYSGSALDASSRPNPLSAPALLRLWASLRTSHPEFFSVPTAP